MADGKPRVAVWIGAAVVAAGAVAAVLAISGGGSPTDADAERGGTGSTSGAGVGSTSGAGSGSPGGSEPGSESASGLLTTARGEASAGHYVQALGHYQRAYALDSAPSTLLEVGRMQHLSGRCREARRTTQRVLAASPPADIAGHAQDLLVRIGRCD